MMIIEKVLLATDLSLPSQQLTDDVAEFSSMGLEEVVLVYVIDVRSFQRPEPLLLEQKRAELEAKGIKVKAVAPLGFPAQEIVKIAQQEEVSMIAIASHGEGFIRKLFLGSTVTDVIRLSDLPVMIFKYEDGPYQTHAPIAPHIFKKVLVPLDFSIHSDNLLQQIKESALLLQEVILLSVIDKARNESDLLASLYEKEHKLAIVKKDLEQLGLKVKSQFVQGTASLNIMEVADQEEVSLIAMATRGEGLIKELMLGSTAHAVARRCKQPLLLIPPR